MQENNNEVTEQAEELINTDDNSAGSNFLNEAVTDTNNQIEKLEAEIAEQKDKYLRLLADFENYKRRTAKESLELRSTANKELMVALLDVMDDCDRAEKQLNETEDIEKQKEGIHLVFNKIRSILTSKGLKAMSSIHTEFNVEHHEAITEIPAPTEELKNKVLDEVQKGYFLNDKIIRFAKVVVGN